MTTEEKDAEIERLKGELAHVKFLAGPPEAVAQWAKELRHGIVEAMSVCKSVLRSADEIDGACPECGEPCRPTMKHSEECSIGLCRAFLQKHTPPLNCGSAAAGESPSHSGGGKVCTLCGGSGIQELPLGCMGTEVCVLCLGTGKSALREVPPTEFRAESCQPIASVQMGVGQTKDCTASQPDPNWRPRHMDEGDDYVNEPRTGPVSDGPPGQEQKHEKGAGV